MMSYRPRRHKLVISNRPRVSSCSSIFSPPRLIFLRWILTNYYLILASAATHSHAPTSVVQGERDTAPRRVLTSADTMFSSCARADTST